MNTRSVKKSEIVEKWFLVDAKGVRLGRLSTKVASILLGKQDVNRVNYLSPQNKVVIVNAEKIDIHPRKRIGKMYYRHSGYPGGFKDFEFDELQKLHPTRILELAIKGMLPNTKMTDEILSNNLYVYEGQDHKHEAQKPVKVEF